MITFNNDVNMEYDLLVDTMVLTILYNDRSLKDNYMKCYQLPWWKIKFDNLKKEISRRL